MNRANFINPYNFIPLSKEKTEKTVAGELYTGVIEYSMLTKTPLFIPNSSNEKVFANVVTYKEVEETDEEKKKTLEKKYREDHKSYDFFSYTDLSSLDDTVPEPAVPVIPGSEMRGMIRSNYETITNSCMFSVDDNEILGKRTTHAFQSGLIERKIGEKGQVEYSLWEAEDCIFHEKNEKGYWKEAHKSSKYVEGQKCYIALEKRSRGKTLVTGISPHEKYGYTEAYVIKGEDSPDGKNKKHCLHFFIKKNKNYKTVNVEVLDNALRAYQNQKEDAYMQYSKQWELFKQGEGNRYFPVYFNFVDSGAENPAYIMLSPATFTREIYKNKLSDMIAKHGKCKDEKHLCPACALFGTLEKNFSQLSKVRFSDMECVTEASVENLYYPIRTVSALANPKLSNMEFYFKRPDENAVFWTVDYWVDVNGNINSYVPEINGRKFYWHAAVENIKEDATNLNTTIRPLKEGIQFAGKVYFENIDKEELDTLIYVLQAGDRKALGSKTNGYKLGRAKPLGYGSVEIAVDKVMLRKVVKGEDGIQIQSIAYAIEELYKEPKFDETIKQNFAFLTSFDALEGAKVSYPKVDGKDEIFAWFASNHKVRKNYADDKEPCFVESGMANTREEFSYNEYVQAMQPELQKTKYANTIQKTFVGKIVTYEKNKGITIESNGRTYTYARVFSKSVKPESGMWVKYVPRKRNDGKFEIVIVSKVKPR